MKINYADHYDEKYFTGKKRYRDGKGAEALYHGPALTWEGFSALADALGPLVPGKTLLDIGCSGGDFAARMAKVHGYDAYGVEVSEYAIKNCVPSMKGRIALEDITTCPSLLGDNFDFPARFDVVMATDLLEHIYAEDLDRTFEWMVDKSKRWLFFCVAIADGEEFVHTKGEVVPLQHERTAVSGHVNVRNWRYWVRYFAEKGLKVRWDLGYLFQMGRELHPGLKNTGGWNMGSTWILEKK